MWNQTVRLEIVTCRQEKCWGPGEGKEGRWQRWARGGARGAGVTGLVLVGGGMEGESWDVSVCGWLGRGVGSSASLEAAG